ncbi:GH3 auxin-responsive promoter [Acetobacter orientalis]|uniref:GH3 auxin-responsive promoter n=1 Tax=Acetobacter orientalis TaxID=146474 RepID=A0A2Z5ZH44_9PROT|nr:GH3 auxin-responsive promoter [Acetobacter orientalis]
MVHIRNNKSGVGGEGRLYSGPFQRLFSQWRNFSTYRDEFL